ncbi:putative RNA methyltransferase [Paenibacillus sp. CN-4]|uniref:putative RNA methyltransferase n=1 Tax=Paenibacillus nanchangensis TaxID=3348343 RepID=UPI00397A297B
MSSANKRAAETLSKHAGRFACPVCGTEMAMNREGTAGLVCTAGHRFDMARQGYINLLAKGGTPSYDKQWFEARRIVSRSGFFAPLDKELARILQEIPELLAEEGALLEAGCGEGSHLGAVHAMLAVDGQRQPAACGMDIAKEGVRLAAAAYPDIAWCVSDLAGCPFRDGQFAAILNLLSPANYTEFHRLLAPGGRLVKAVPGTEHLREWRELLYTGAERREYANDRTIRLFESRFRITDTRRVTYRFPVPVELAEPLLRMTPLSWGADETARRRAAESGIRSLTANFMLLIGERPED